MGLWLLTNTASRDSTKIIATNASNGAVGAAERRGVDCIRGGPRFLKWTQSGSADRIVGYVNKTVPMDATHMVMVDAALHEEATTREIRQYSAYPGTYSAITADFAGECGVDGRDCVRVLTQQTGNEGLAVLIAGTYAKTLRQLYFCQGLEFKEASQVSFTKVAAWNAPTLYEGHAYKLHGRASFTAGPLTRSQAETYRNLPKHDPVFFYDDSGTTNRGDHIPHKLWHCIILSEAVVVNYAECAEDEGQDMVFISFEVGILKTGVG